MTSIRTSRRTAAAALLLMVTLAPALRAQSSAAPSLLAAAAFGEYRPRLVVVISIDQFRDDYLRRLSDLFLPPMPSHRTYGGFRYLTAIGSAFLDARHGHIPLSTGPGHSVILTGAYPYKTGIVSNVWLDRSTGREVYCVQDSTHPIVGAQGKSGGIGPLNLRSTTVGDELKMATGRRAKVVALALKDRAAILMGGHMQDACLWFDDASGRWISSTAYCPDGKLPAWVEALNDEKIPERTIGTTWELSLSAEGRARALSVTPGAPVPGVGGAFPHRIEAGARRRYQPFTYAPDANEFVLRSALRAVAAEGLGADSIPDLLAINLSTNDYVGHAFGPYSLEAIDLTVRTDSALSRFLTGLDGAIPGGLANVVVVITADHGVAPVPEGAAALGVRSGRVVESRIDSAARAALGLKPEASEKSGAKDAPWSVAYVEPYIYLSDAVIEQGIRGGKGGSRREVEEKVADAVTKVPGIYACYTRGQIMAGMLPPNDIARHIANGFHPLVAGDVLVVTEPNYFPDDAPTGFGTTHGTPYIYDTHVPLLIAGFGIRHGVWTTPVSPADIAPTLSLLLGIEYPSACDGIPLKEALEEK